MISALGAPISPSSFTRASYLETDLIGNLALLEAARAARVRRFVYVSVHSEPSYADTHYLRAHVQFEQALPASGLEYGIVRPTGVFGAFLEMLPLARLGLIPLIGDGSARTNPVHEGDVAARIIAVAAHADGRVEVDIGGPETLSRREIATLAFRALGKTPRLVSSPPAIARLSSAVIGVMNPRSRDFIDFITLASLHDCLAPPFGERRLGAYLEEKANGRAA